MAMAALAARNASGSTTAPRRAKSPWNTGSPLATAIRARPSIATTRLWALGSYSAIHPSRDAASAASRGSLPTSSGSSRSSSRTCTRGSAIASFAVPPSITTNTGRIGNSSSDVRANHRETSARDA